MRDDGPAEINPLRLERMQRGGQIVPITQQFVNQSDCISPAPPVTT